MHPITVLHMVIGRVIDRVYPYLLVVYPWHQQHHNTQMGRRDSNKQSHTFALQGYKVLVNHLQKQRDVGQMGFKMGSLGYKEALFQA